MIPKTAVGHAVSEAPPTTAAMLRDRRPPPTNKVSWQK